MPNLLGYSESLGSTAVWSNSFSGGVAITEDAAADPFGSTNADNIAKVDSSSDGVLQDFDLTPDVEHTVSGYFQNVDSNRTDLRIRETAAASSLLAFDWTAGTPSTFSSSEASDIRYTPLEDDWWRISFKFTPPNSTMRVLVIPERNGANGHSINVTGFQVEPGNLGNYLRTGSSEAILADKRGKSRLRARKRSQF